MKNIKLLLVLLLFPLCVYSQQGNSFLFFLLLPKSIPAPSLIYYPDTLSGYIVYNNQKITSRFVIQNSHIKTPDTAIYLGDKNLKYMDLKANEKNIRLERTEENGYLKNVVADTLGLTIYNNFSLSDKLHKRSIFFKYKDEYYYVKKSLFRKIDRSIMLALNNISFDDPHLKDFIIEKLAIKQEEEQ
ncbi:hypothetical protein GN157_00190 [Flavobacterium rakeshii]|uniref:Uncharacterized protein n=1 Tax=Flavobacterium rakeshii TaxID=1038845 RepID=A0A6N8HAC9_9FLAO|nr:hypothetical protein [Flavobacterium rakeshii]MUV02116.1 hypothetical protein [Flavobacterium rakeshii]